MTRYTTASWERPLWQSERLARSDPFKGMFDWHYSYSMCNKCGARVFDRGVHLKFHTDTQYRMQVLMELSQILGDINDQDCD